MNSYPATYTLTQGELVLVNNHKGVVVEIVDLKTALIRDYETGDINQITISDLKPYPIEPVDTPHLDAVPEDKLKIAHSRYEHIKPLIFAHQRTRQMVATRASEVGVHPTTLYKWIRRFEDSKLLTSLVPGRRNDIGTKRLSPNIEKIISEAIESEYLTKQKKSQVKVCNEVRKRCLQANLKPPHPNTVRNRIKTIPSYLRTTKRHGHRTAKEAFSPIKGPFPGADYPLAIVQIDHTLLDVILVDDIHRKPIGRPWLTLAMDVFSRMVLGYHVSFDSPSALSVGLCLAHAILPKKDWLAKYKVDGEWPCYGVPKTVHADNAKEFRGTLLQRACEQYGIDLEWRPVARPEFGGHIERLLGTFAGEIKSLPGATFSNIQERGRYKSEKKAALSLSEFEQWLATLIIQAYHLKRHSTLKTAPLKKYEEGIIGSDNCLGTGLPTRVMDENRLRLDFTPFIKRTIQKYGVLIDHIYYWADSLRKWINSPDTENPNIKRKFIFKRDPRDISTIWFYDPDVETYFPVPYRDTSHPPISIWEYREAKRRAQESETSSIDEYKIFEAYSKMRKIEEEAQGRTAAARRTATRRMTINSISNKISEPTKEPIPPDTEEDLDDLQPFDVMEEL